MYDGNTQNSFARLADGSWGVRVALRSKSSKVAHPSPGDEVLVRKANGEHSRVTLGSIVDRDRGAFPGPAVYYRTASRGGRRPYRAEDEMRARRREHERKVLIEAGRRLADELAKAEALHEAYDSEGYDGEWEIREEAIARIENMRLALNTLREQYRSRFLASAA